MTQPHNDIIPLSVLRQVPPEASESTLKRSKGFKGTKLPNWGHRQTTVGQGPAVSSACFGVYSVFTCTSSKARSTHCSSQDTQWTEKPAEHTQPLPPRAACPQLSNIHVTTHWGPNELPEAQAEYLMKLLSMNGYCDQSRVPVHLPEGLYNSRPYCWVF